MEQCFGSLHTHVCDAIAPQVDVGERPVGLQDLCHDLPNPAALQLHSK